MPTAQGVSMSMCKVSDGRSVQSPNLRMKAVCDGYIDRLHTYIRMYTYSTQYVRMYDRVCKLPPCEFHSIR